MMDTEKRILHEMLPEADKSRIAERIASLEPPGTGTRHPIQASAFLSSGMASRLTIVGWLRNKSGGKLT